MLNEALFEEDMEDENSNKIEIPEPSSSIALELFIFIHKIYMIIYYIILLGLFMFKRYAFDYEYKRIIPDVIIGIVALILNIFRLRISSIGNKTERSLILLIAIIIGVINFIGYIYFMWLQLYVTYFDVVFSAIGLIITFIEIFFSLWTIFNIKVNEKTD